MKRVLTGLSSALLLANCALVVEPTYRRAVPPPPSVDGSTTMDVVVEDAHVSEDVSSDGPWDADAESTFDAGFDARVDVVALDARDVPTVDRPNVDVSTAVCGDVPVCRSFWCGCGRCNPAEIQCVSDNRRCALGCPSDCPEIDQVVCGCVGNSCQAIQPRVDAGVDAGLPLGAPCGHPLGDCAAGLMCCYPCGVEGCANICTVPIRGMCPLIP